MSKNAIIDHKIRSEVNGMSERLTEFKKIVVMMY